VVELVWDGRTNAAIGERLFVSTRAVQVHLTRIDGKLGVTGPTQLAGRQRSWPNNGRSGERRWSGIEVAAAERS
jgi:hypothetical protein